MEEMGFTLSKKGQCEIRLLKMDVFNQSLLGKQAGRLLLSHDSLVARVFKVKYYPNTNLSLASLSHNTNYVCNSIWGVKSLLREGLVWRVGNVRI